MPDHALAGARSTKQSSTALRLDSVVSLTPPYSYTNAEVAVGLQLPALPRVCRRIGIDSRRAFLQLDLESGRPIADGADCELEIAEQVANLAIEEAAISRRDIAALCFISCTAQHG